MKSENFAEGVEKPANFLKGGILSHGKLAIYMRKKRERDRKLTFFEYFLKPEFGIWIPGLSFFDKTLKW